MDKEAEANGKDGQEANGETGSDIVESEFTEKREGRKVITPECESLDKDSTFNVSHAKVHTYTWLPAGEPRALLFLCHG